MQKILQISVLRNYTGKEIIIQFFLNSSREIIKIRPRFETAFSFGIQTFSLNQSRPGTNSNFFPSAETFR